MSKNYIRLMLGETEQGLKFNMGTLKNIKDITGGDPFAFFVGDDINSQIKQIAVILQAALLANYSSKRLDPDFTAADCERWAEDLSMEEALNLVNTFREAYLVSGEGNADTRGQGTADVESGPRDSVRRAEAEPA